MEHSGWSLPWRDADFDEKTICCCHVAFFATKLSGPHHLSSALLC